MSVLVELRSWCAANHAPEDRPACLFCLAAAEIARLDPEPAELIQTAGSPAFKCRVCHASPKWSLLRRGDAVVDWACHAHLSAVCDRLQRDHEVTEVVVKNYPKSVEWSSISRTLNTIACGIPDCEGPHP